MLLLYVASDFPLSKGRSQQVQSWMRPLFPQDWSVFAPDPLRYTVHLEVRTNPGGTPGPWIDLTAQDNAAYRHQPLPSKEDQQVLRKALSRYRAGRPEAGTAAQRTVGGRYLRNLVLARLRDRGTDPGSGINMRVRTTRIPAPDGTGRTAPPRYQSLGHWRVPS
nr:DUF5819 family protein [Streptomyces boncukensis]